MNSNGLNIVYEDMESSGASSTWVPLKRYSPNLVETDDHLTNDTLCIPFVRKTGSISIQPSEFNDYQNKEFKHVFECLDIDSDSKLSVDDMSKIFRALNAPNEKATQYASDFIRNATKNKESDSIDYSQFTSYFCTTYYGHFSTYELMSVFNRLDMNKKGYLDMSDIERLDEQLKWSLKHDLNKMFEHCDQNKDGKICFKDFVHLMNQK